MIKKILKIAVIIIVVVFAIAQFVRPDLTNPPVVASDKLVANVPVPADVQQILTRSCNDCHTNETVYPWYSYVTPFNWFLESHIRDGRRELNLSEWKTYPPDKQAHKLEELCEVVQEGSMPLPSYLWIHRDAVLREGEAKVLCDWATAESSRISKP